MGQKKGRKARSQPPRKTSSFSAEARKSDLSRIASTPVDSLVSPQATVVEVLQADVLIVIATTREAKYVLADLPKSDEEESEWLDSYTNGTFRKFDVVVGDNGTTRSLKVLLLKLCGAGEVNACAATMSTLSRFQVAPLLAVNIGISGALSSAIHLGDVIVAKLVKRYFENTRVQDQKATVPLSSDPGATGAHTGSQPAHVTPLAGCFYKRRITDDVRLTEHLWRMIESPEASPDQGKWQEEWRQRADQIARDELGEDYHKVATAYERGIAKPNIRVEPIGSGPMLIDSQIFREWLTNMDGSLDAVDMESGGFGIGVALTEISRRPHNVLIVRGISDLANGTKKQTDGAELHPPVNPQSPISFKLPPERIRQIAMRRALALVLILLKGECGAALIRRRPHG